MLGFALVHARTISAAGTTTPDDKGQIALSASYFSVFANYMSYQDPPIILWREANDLAGKIGGWRFYAREGKQSDSAGSSPIPKTGDTQQPAVPPVNSDQHHGHGSKP
jgi:hypothetical protein